MPPEIPKGDFPILPNEFAFIKSNETGRIRVAVGPCKAQVGQNEEIVEFDQERKIFVTLNERRAQKLIVIPKGWYAVLTNPATTDRGQPKPGENQEIEPKQLLVGIKVVIPGDQSFALWPGQMIKIVEGHTLKSNHFLLCRVYDEAAARINVDKAVIKTVDEKEPAEKKTGEAKAGSEIEKPAEKKEGEVKSEVKTEKPAEKKDDKPVDPVKDIIRKATTGQRIIIKGKDISFFIPPTGIEVLREGDFYVQDAVTLEELEYCVLVSESGVKRFCYGPAIVFPEADEAFMTASGGARTRKFRAIDLNQISGVYVKVIRAYTGTDKDGQEREYKEGEELFITGEDQPFYFPRPEHSLISYGKSPVHFAIAVPKGDGRYVMNRMTSDIRTEVGPKMLLLDPRQDVAVRRVLNPTQVRLWFPNNSEAEKVNATLRQLRDSDADFVTERKISAKGFKGAGTEKSLVGTEMNQLFAMGEPVSEGFGGEELNRKSSFTAPPTVTLDTKYEGAVKLEVWPGYAVMVKDSSGKRKVVKGPQSVILAYDEVLEVLRLSTAKPKSTDRLLETIYLLTMANKVSDIIDVETSDFCQVSLKLSYRVNFEGEPEKWWNVENYVKLLCDHLRSLLKNMAKRHTIEEFYTLAIDLIRDAILGKADDKNPRPGKAFDENGMKVYDVEVLDIVIEDAEIAESLRSAQRAAVEATIEKKTLQITLERTKGQEETKRAQAKEVTATRVANAELQITELTASEKVLRETEEQKTATVITKIKSDLLKTEAQSDKTAKEKQLFADVEKLAAELAHGLDQLKLEYSHTLAIKQDEERARAAAAGRDLAELTVKSENDLHEATCRMQTNLDEEKWQKVLAFRGKLAAIQKDLEDASAKADVSRLTAITPKLIEALEGLGNKELATALATHLPAAGGALGLLTGRAGINALKEMVKGTNLEAGLNALTTDPASVVDEAQKTKPE